MENEWDPRAAGPWWVQGKALALPDFIGHSFCWLESNHRSSWSAGPVNAVSLWKPTAVLITKGGELVTSFAKTPGSARKYCSKCGGHLMTNHPGMGQVDVYAATIPKLAFGPGLHVHCGETVLRIHDGLPKFKDMPGAFGGSDEVIAT